MEYHDAPSHQESHADDAAADDESDRSTGADNMAATTSRRIVAPPTDESRTQRGFVIYNKTFDDVDLTPEATNPIFKFSGDTNKSKCSPGSRLSSFSRLKSIAGIPTSVIKLDDIRAFSTRNKVKGIRRMSKEDICLSIVYAKERYDAGESPPYWTPWSRRKGCKFTDPDCEADSNSQLNQVNTRLSANESKKAKGTSQLQELAFIGEQGDSLLQPSQAIEKTHGSRKFVALQKQIADSIKEKNRSIQLKETVQAASATLHDIRQEKDKRKSLMKELAEHLGDDGSARGRIRVYKRTKFDDDNDFNESEEEIMESILQQDELIEHLTTQHTALSEEISKLLQLKSGRSNAWISSTL